MVFSIAHDLHLVSLQYKEFSQTNLLWLEFFGARKAITGWLFQWNDLCTISLIFTGVERSMNSHGNLATFPCFFFHISMHLQFICILYFLYHQDNCFPNQDVQNTVVKFLKDYFMVYDSDDRSGLFGAYHEDAVFSLTVAFNRAVPNK